MVRKLFSVAICPCTHPQATSVSESEGPLQVNSSGAAVHAGRFGDSRPPGDDRGVELSPPEHERWRGGERSGGGPLCATTGAAVPVTAPWPLTISLVPGVASPLMQPTIK